MYYFERFGGKNRCLKGFICNGMKVHPNTICVTILDRARRSAITKCTPVYTKYVHSVSEIQCTLDLVTFQFPQKKLF